MKVSIFDALKSEQEVFKKFSSFASLSDDVVLFYNKETSQIPHWNLVYSMRRDFEYTKKEIDKSREIFKSAGVAGHVLRRDKTFSSQANEIAEYFYRDPLESRIQHHGQFQILPVDLKMFSNIVAEVFTFEESAKDLFYHKMVTLSQIDGSRFFILGMNGQPCGTLSAFRGTPGSYFLFNMAVLPRFRKMGIATAHMNFAIDQIDGRVFGWTHSKVMRKSVAPHLGMISLGMTYLVPINKMDFLQKSNFREEE